MDMRGITVGFDGKRAVSNMTGLGNYSRLVLESLSAAYPQMRLRVYTPRTGDNERWEKVRRLANVDVRVPGRGEARLGRAAWRTWGISGVLAAEGVQLYHGLSNELPLNIRSAGVPSVVTMHDVIYRRLPYCYKPADRLLYDFKYGRSCRNAIRIIAVSERTKLDVMEYYGVDADKVDVVYQGCDDIFREPWEEARVQWVREKYGLGRRYIIQVGSIERRKNAEASVRALSALPADVDLVLVGRGGEYLRRVESVACELGVRGRIRVFEGVPFRDLPGLYRGSIAAVYPSYYEGFGIPVLEALCCGVPCVAATGSCLEEAGGKGALYVSPDDAAGLGEALHSLIDDEGLRVSLRGAGAEHASLFRNEDIPMRLTEVYARVLKQ